MIARIKYWFLEKHKGTRRDELIMFITLIIIALTAAVGKYLNLKGIISEDVFLFALMIVFTVTTVEAFTAKEMIKTKLGEYSTPTGEEP